MTPAYDLGSLGLSMDLPNQIDQYAHRLVQDQNLAGCVTLVSRWGKVAHLGAYGYQDIEQNCNMQVGTLFRIASLAKPITTVAALKLWEKRKYDLDDPIGRFLPGYSNLRVQTVQPDGSTGTIPARKQITFRHLLSHTSGFAYDFTADASLQQSYAEARLFRVGEPITDSIDRLARLPLNFQPGEAFRYGTSTDVLGYLIELIADTTLCEFLKENIFYPLDMHDTGHVVPINKIHCLASLYRSDDESALLAEQTAGKIPYTAGNPFCHGGGGLISTATDYFHFLSMLLNGGKHAGERILEQSTVAMMTTNQLRKEMLPLRYIYGPNYDSRRNGYGGHGFGVNVQIGARSDHLSQTASFGCIGAHNQLFWVDPTNGITGIFFTQLLPFAKFPFEAEFKKIVYSAITGRGNRSLMHQD